MSEVSKANAGFTLIEAMIVVALVSVLAALAIAGWGGLIMQKQITSDMSNLSDTFKLAHSESIKRRGTITISFRLFNGTNPSWCYGLSNVGDCDCRVANACTIDGVERVTNDTDYTTTMTITNLSGPAGGKFVQFEGVRGTVSNSGNVSFSQSGYSGTVTVNAMGFVEKCSNTLQGVQAC
jgi:type IV fimbrial biogenesis protein FimT